MGFWKRSKNETKRLLTLNLHSYWEVFYLDLFVLIVSFIISILFGWVLDWFGVDAPLDNFFYEHIEKPVETNVIKMIVPSGLNDETYFMITYCLILFIELVLLHILFCELYRLKKKNRMQEINPSADEKCDLVLPQYNKKNCSDKEEKVPIYKRILKELARLISLDLHSCWEVFYVDVLMIMTAFLLSIPFHYTVEYFRLEKVYVPVAYIENSLETSIVRPIASSGLDDYTYKLITMIAMLVCEVALFHAVATFVYLCSRSEDPKPDADVEKNTEYFSRTRISPSDEKERPLKTIYESIYTISSSSLYPIGSTEKLIDKTAFP